jgi:choline kinase
MARKTSLEQKMEMYLANDALGRENVALRAELAAAKAERTALAAHVERLRGALEEIGKQLDACQTFVVGGCMGQTTDNIMKATVYHRVPYMLRELVLDALSSTPAQSLAAHDAALLREVAERKAWSMDGGRTWMISKDELLAEADRIEKEALNG